MVCLTLLPSFIFLSAALLTLLDGVTASGRSGRALNDSFLGSLEMSAPILSGWKRKRMGKKEGGGSGDGFRDWG